MTRKMLSDVKRTPKSRPSVNGSRWAVLNEFIDLRMADLPRAEVSVWMVLFRDNRGGVSSSGTTDIARRAGLSVRHTHRAIQSLIDRGLLRRLYRGGLGRGVSKYIVTANEGDK